MGATETDFAATGLAVGRSAASDEEEAWTGWLRGVVWVERLLVLAEVVLALLPGGTAHVIRLTFGVGEELEHFVPEFSEDGHGQTLKGLPQILSKLDAVQKGNSRNRGCLQDLEQLFLALL